MRIEEWMFDFEALEQRFDEIIEAYSIYWNKIIILKGKESPVCPHCKTKHSTINVGQGVVLECGVCFHQFYAERIGDVYYIIGWN
jgi:hypothetical protein